MILWIKAAHIISVISWMVGLLYLPRLFVYHSEAEIGSKLSETFKTMEKRLLKIIMTPAMISTWIFGIWTAEAFSLWGKKWLMAKLVLVLILTGYHGLLSGWVKMFAADNNQKSSRFYRIVNEYPTVAVVGIIILVVVKPF
ncbi:protoporphyrinogen oxidase HemJ [Candidatus Endowatersipora endosymbiont of Watersipora subatra]|uniref:protoporphyrinogen oxidase HemJ n=1 Tax=Candidatus Endowatersipora endosymbiont of Watersipora subatra TaxID=3077946 RepID=UPI00312C717E